MALMNNKCVRVSGAAAVTVALLASGCGSKSEQESHTTTMKTSSGEVTSTAERPISTTGAAPAHGDKHVAPIADAQVALRTATGAVPDGQVFELKTDKHDDELQFEAKVASNGAEHKVQVDSTGQRVLSEEKSDEHDKELDKLNGIKINAGQALDAAVQQVPDARFEEVKFHSHHDGADDWEVKLVRPDDAKAEFHVDAQSGAVKPK